MQHRKLHEQNRLSWNAATRAHNSHKKDQATFLKNGGSTLFPEELELLGDVNGRRLLHLQCNAGQDSLSLAASGAEVTGVDISDEAIRFANQLSLQSGLPARFVRADVFDWFEARPPADLFDVVFCSYGAICWISDLVPWARGIAKALRPGGRFVTVEFHPFSMVFDEDLELAYPYFGGGEPLAWPEGVGDYVGRSGEALAPSGFMEGVRDFENPHPVHEFQWGVAEVMQSLIDQGLAIEVIREYPYSNGARLFKSMREIGHKRFASGPDCPALPLMWGMVASKS
jgi:SAM-dependent methyltransferase